MRQPAPAFLTAEWLHVLGVTAQGKHQLGLFDDGVDTAPPVASRYR